MPDHVRTEGSRKQSTAKAAAKSQAKSWTKTKASLSHLPNAMHAVAYCLWSPPALCPSLPAACPAFRSMPHQPRRLCPPCQLHRPGWPSCWQTARHRASTTASRRSRPEQMRMLLLAALHLQPGESMGKYRFLLRVCPTSVWSPHSGYLKWQLTCCCKGVIKDHPSGE